MIIHKYLRFLSFKPFDNKSEAGRAQERYRLALLAAISSLCSKGIMMLVMVVSVRISLPHLGIDRFGIWMTILSLVGLLNFLDFGIGNALTNRVALFALPSNARDLKRCIGASLLILGAVAFCMLCLLYPIAAHLPWQEILKLPSIELYEETHSAMKLFVVLFACNIFFGGINKIFFGLQQGYVANLASAFGSLISLCLILIAVSHGGGISILLLASMAGGFLTSFGLFVLLMIRGQIEMLSWSESMRLESTHLFHVGGSFFFLQIGGIVVFGADTLIIANSLGVASVAIYSVAQRLFQFVTQPFAVMNSGLWPAYANAYMHDDRAFIASTLKRSMRITILGSLLVSIALILFGKSIISWWTHNEINISYMLLMGFALWAVCDAIANAFAMFMNGVSLMKPQIKGLLVLVVIGMPIKIYLVSQFGLVAMLIGFSILFMVNILFWNGIVYRQAIEKFFIKRDLHD